MAKLSRFVSVADISIYLCLAGKSDFIILSSGMVACVQYLVFYDAIEHETKRFSPGERIIFTRNDKALGVKNGHIGIIEKLTPNKIKINLDGRRLTINQKDYASFDHAYALTVYKSQGQTAKNVYIYASNRGQHNREYLYSALSRASHSAKVYCENFQKFSHQCAQAQQKQTSLSMVLK